VDTPEAAIAAVHALGLTAAEEQLVLHDNAATLLGLTARPCQTSWRISALDTVSPRRRHNIARVRADRSSRRRSPAGPISVAPATSKRQSPMLCSPRVVIAVRFLARPTVVGEALSGGGYSMAGRGDAGQTLAREGDGRRAAGAETRPRRRRAETLKGGGGTAGLAAAPRSGAAQDQADARAWLWTGAGPAPLLPDGFPAGHVAAEDLTVWATAMISSNRSTIAIPSGVTSRWWEMASVLLRNIATQPRAGASAPFAPSAREARAERDAVAFVVFIRVANSVTLTPGFSAMYRKAISSVIVMSEESFLASTRAAKRLFLRRTESLNSLHKLAVEAPDFSLSEPCAACVASHSGPRSQNPLVFY